MDTGATPRRGVAWACTCHPSAMPIEASPKGGSLPSTPESSGAASPLRRPCRNYKRASHIRERWRAHENGFSVHMHPVV